MPLTAPDHRSEFFQTSAVLLHALSNSSRIHILTILCEEETSVGSLSNRVGLSQSALSQHLSKLRDVHLVKTRRDAQTIFYRCESTAVLKILGTLSAFFSEEDATVSQAA